jgi:hypothetical protein
MFAVAFVILLGFPSAAIGQGNPPEPTATTQTWSINASGVALPGGKTSIAGVDSGVSFAPSADFILSDRNLVSSDHSLMYFAGQFQLTLPQLSKTFNNMASNVNFLRVRFAPVGSFGVVQVSGRNHYGYTAGAEFDYMLTPKGGWTLGAKGEYAHFPGYSGNAIIEVNASFHF